MSRLSRFRALILLAAIATLPLAAAAVPAGNQAISFTDLVNNQSGNYTWKTSAPAASTKLVSWSDFQTYVNTQTCSVTTATYIMTWSDVLACSNAHTVSLQSMTANGAYSDTHYNATYNSTVGVWTCRTVNGSGPFKVQLPTGTAAPTSASSQISLSLTSINYGSSTQLSAQLYNPSGSAVGSPTLTNSTTLSATYSAAGAPAGGWYWLITSSGASGQTCDPSTGISGSYDSASWSGTASYYQ